MPKITEESTLPIAGEGKVPEGWQLVPKEPTEAMLDVYWRQAGESKEMRIRTHHHSRHRYDELLAAAPALIYSPGKDGGQEVKAVAWEVRTEDGYPVGVYHFKPNADQVSYYRQQVTPLYAAPIPHSTVDPDRGWRSIAEAPKDGTDIIARTTQDEVFACRWFGDNEDENGGSWLVYGADEVRPREWIPMPTALKAKSPSSDREASEVVERLKELADYLDIHHFASDRHKAADMVSRARTAIAEAKGSGQ